MTTTSYLVRHVRAAWRYRGIRYRPAKRRTARVHWTRLEAARRMAEDLGIDSKGRVICRSCGNEYERAHVCPFP